jgi:hypothetical protein
VRLGELLIAAKVITEAQLQEALRAQVMWGARLGTALVELGMIDLDGLSNALAHQQHLPAALATHFDGADRALQLLLSPNHAERFACIPLRRVGKRAAAVAVAAPLQPREQAIVADELGVDPERVIIAIAPELRIRYALERVYNIARPQRFLRAPGSPRSLPKQVELGGERLELESVPEPLPRDRTSERRRYIEPLVAAPRAKTGPITPRSGVIGDRVTLLSALRASADREQVANRTVAAVADLEPTAAAAVLLTPRSGVAVSWAIYRSDGRLLPPLAVALDHPGVVKATLERRAAVRAPAGDLTPVDQLLLVTLGLTRGELLVEPLMVGERLVAVLVVASATRANAPIVAAIAAAASEAFARLVRAALK